MKKIRLLQALILTTTFTGAVSTLIGCSTSEEIKIIYEGNKQIVTDTPSFDLVFKVSKSLSDDDQITISKKITSTTGIDITCGEMVWSEDRTQGTLSVTLVKDQGDLHNFDSVTFDLTISSKGKDNFDATFDSFSVIFNASEELNPIPSSKLDIDNGVLKGIDTTEIEDYNAIVVPANVVEISANLFPENNILPDNIEYLSFDNDGSNLPLFISDSAFKNCTSFRQIIFPERLAYVNENAFSGCSNVRVLDLSNWSEKKTNSTSPFIEDNIFSGFAEKGAVSLSCAMTPSVYFMLTGAGLNKNWFSSFETTPVEVAENFNCFKIVGYDDIYLESVNAAIWGSSELSIPATINYICPNALANSGFYSKTKIIKTEPNSQLIQIFGNAFKSLDATIEVNLSTANNLKMIDCHCFGNSKELQKIVLPINIVELGAWCFKNCEALTSINIDETTLTKIPVAAFQGCHKLKKLPFTRSSRIDWIGARSFIGLNFTEDVVIPTKVKYIGASAFELNENTNISFEAGSQLEYLGDAAFKNTATTNLSLSARLEYIGTGALAACPSLTQLSIGGENRKYASSSNAIYTKDFKKLVVGCSGTTSYRDDIEEIMPYAFYGANISYETLNLSGCSNLLTIGKDAFAFMKTDLLNGFNIKLPSSVKYIGDSAFYDSHVNQVNFDDLTSLEFAGTDLFANDKKITEIVIPNGFEYIPDGCFRDSGIVSITIPNTIKRIGEKAFDYAWNSAVLKNIDISSYTTIPQWEKTQVFSEDETKRPYGGTIYINQALSSDDSIAAIKELFKGIGLTNVDTKWTITVKS